MWGFLETEMITVGNRGAGYSRLPRNNPSQPRMAIPKRRKEVKLSDRNTEAESEWPKPTNGHKTGNEKVAGYERRYRKRASLWNIKHDQQEF